MKKLCSSVFWLAIVSIGLFASQAGALVISNDMVDDIHFCEWNDNIVMTIVQRLPVNVKSYNSWQNKKCITLSVQAGFYDTGRQESSGQKDAVSTLDTNLIGVSRINAVAGAAESTVTGIPFVMGKLARAGQAYNSRQLIILAQKEVPEVTHDSTEIVSYHTSQSNIYTTAIRTLNKISKNWEIKKSFQENCDNSLLDRVQGGFTPDIQLERRLNETLSISIGGKRNWGDRELQGVTDNKRRYDVSLGFHWSF